MVAAEAVAAEVDTTAPQLKEAILTIGGKQISAINKNGVWKATVTDVQLAELARS